MRYICLLTIVLCAGCVRQPLTGEALHERASEELDQFKKKAMSLHNARRAYNVLEAHRALSAEWRRRQRKSVPAADRWLLRFIEDKDPTKVAEAVFGPGGADVDAMDILTTRRTVYFDRPPSR